MLQYVREFALKAHGAQTYGSKPYVVHLDAVAQIVEPFGETAQVIAYLHDVLEDTSVGVEQIKKEFGDLVAQCVELLTDAPGVNRKERKAKIYARMALISGPTEITLVVKTADRLANVQSCVREHNRSLLAMYKSEHQVFRNSVYRQGLCDAIWSELDRLLSITP